MYDIIGDVHGYAAQLKKLLIEMGYQKTNGSYSHPTRKAIFVGRFYQPWTRDQKNNSNHQGNG